MQRYGSVIRLRPEKREEYRRLHAEVWPEVLATIRDCNIRNYSIFERDGWLSATTNTTERTSSRTCEDGSLLVHPELVGADGSLPGAAPGSRAG